ncbi:inosine monophosphate dehydrogenase [Bimuria novae-zelandiae CBS 107.79]|uniref:Inosine monophosphate dehydrogenase n=1 Tax=Bimuria novae-zelandiae CBS 107.79 TaxID=1447943 RepID=A0A6A5VRX7_9PLEO|nr:inosine monophosphate dehydrogenase [Bimuria novae-zelandiae CBS 107.79]
MASQNEWLTALKTYLPWTTSPLVISAPMGGFAWSPLATAVSLAGGLGLIGSLNDMSSNPAITSSLTLPLGVGILAFICKIEDVIPLIAEFKSAVVWLFAASELALYKDWVDALRRASLETKVWIQVGNVEAALHVASSAYPGALCLQGADAGGHGFEKGAGIISLVPEAADALRNEGLGHIPLLASGGIADGRGVAAALALGAAGVVAILEAEDGGQLRGPNIWPEAYNGRSMVIQSYEDYDNGVSLEEIQRLHNEAVEREDKGFATGRKGRVAIWAGTGAGIVKEVKGAADIVEKVRKEAKEITQGLGKW